MALLVGAVAYDPKVVTIWEGLRDYFRAAGVPIDFALFSNYERQIDELLAGHVDVAWNTPLAHVRVKQGSGGKSLSLGMRDSDRDFRAKIVARKDAGLRAVAELAGRKLAVGSRDSTQARILPLHFLKREGVDLARVELVPFDSDLGKHGDTGRSELEVLAAVADGRAEAGCVGDLVWVSEQAAGRVDPSRVEVLWTTPPFDHCMFDALPSLDAGAAEAFRRALYAMSWDDPRHRRILELEGLKQWLPPREEGYQSLREALADLGG
ncbi:MAG TPA: PhnD/SsuA/transferrin family substrate-binding protein [Polyangia bacterium]|nr:PhnD/SsuA/transferrin family substrate-binding protein [Polyangia bacterium]